MLTMVNHKFTPIIFLFIFWYACQYVNSSDTVPTRPLSLRGGQARSDPYNSSGIRSSSISIPPKQTSTASNSSTTKSPLCTNTVTPSNTTAFDGVVPISSAVLLSLGLATTLTASNSNPLDITISSVDIKTASDSVSMSTPTEFTMSISTQSIIGPTVITPNSSTTTHLDMPTASLVSGISFSSVSRYIGSELSHSPEGNQTSLSSSSGNFGMVIPSMITPNINTSSIVPSENTFVSPTTTLVDLSAPGTPMPTGITYSRAESPQLSEETQTLASSSLISSIIPSLSIVSTTALPISSSTTLAPLPPLITGPYSGFPQIIDFPGFTLSTTNTVSGVTTNVATRTRGEDGQETPFVILFPCLLFCSQGGGGGFGILLNIGPLPGIYYPPNLPPLVIGTNGLPTPNPPDAPPKPTPDPPSNKPGDKPGDKPGNKPDDKPGDNPDDKPGDKPGDKPNDKPGPKPGPPPGPTQGPPKTEAPSERPTPSTSFSSSTSSSSSCSTRTASACSTICVGANCSTSCSPIATGCSATCTGTACNELVTIEPAPWHSGGPIPNKWVAINEFDRTKAKSVALAIKSLIAAWDLEDGFADNTTSATLTQISTTFITSILSSSSKVESSPSEVASSSTAPQSSPAPSLGPGMSPETSPPPEASPPPNTGLPTKAISIMVRLLWEGSTMMNFWTVFTTPVGKQADGCGDPIYQSSPWDNPQDIESPPWPQGVFTMPLFDEVGCQYLNPEGKGPGVLRCPSMTQDVQCKEDSEKSEYAHHTQCRGPPGLLKFYHRTVFCEW